MLTKEGLTTKKILFPTEMPNFRWIGRFLQFLGVQNGDICYVREDFFCKLMLGEMKKVRIFAPPKSIAESKNYKDNHERSIAANQELGRVGYISHVAKEPRT